MTPNDRITSAQLARMERDLAIAIAHAGGLSQRSLSRVHGLARSRIAQILIEVGEGWKDPKRFTTLPTGGHPNDFVGRLCHLVMSRRGLKK